MFYGVLSMLKGHLFYALFFLLLISCESLSERSNPERTAVLEKDLSNSIDSPLRILNDRPLNVETKVHALDDEVTPTHKMFVRHNGIVPPIAYKKDFSTWSLTVDGEVFRPKNFTLDDLKKTFKAYEYQLTLECGGNGRAGFYPRTPGNQWTYGAVACPLWKGVLLRDVLNHVGLKDTAVYLAYEAHDIHLSGDPSKQVISRGVPITKALDPMTLLAFELNGKPLPAEHGAPLRLVCPGYPGSVSGKWLKRLWVRDQVHDGSKMTGNAYRIPPFPVKPGSKVPIDHTWKIIEKMPVKSIITYPKSGLSLKREKKDHMIVRGFAWTGEKKVVSVHLSFDYGQTWHKAQLKKARNPFAWQRWEVKLSFPSKGYFQLWSRAQDSSGRLQPMIVPHWNPKGYLNNAMPRIEIYIE